MPRKNRNRRNAHEFRLKAQPVRITPESVMRDRWAIAFFVAWALACGALVCVVLRHPLPAEPRPVCLVSHSQVVLIPTLCDKAQVCDMPIVAKVCDQIEIENPEVKP